MISKNKKYRLIYWSIILSMLLDVSINLNDTVYGFQPLDAKISDWAIEEINEADRLGIIRNIDTYENYTEKITRKDFTCMAIEFITFQFGFLSDNADYRFKWYCRDLNNNYGLGFNENLESVQYFQDVSEDLAWDINIAYDMGIIKGKSNILFEPDAFITREEAAVLLNNVYNVYGKTTGSEMAETINFIDSQQISDWAINSVNTMSSMKVIMGDENGYFNPKDSFTIEQAIIMFNRLNKNAEYSILKNNVEPIFSYQDIKQAIIDGNSDILGEPYTDYLTWENDRYLVLAADYGLWAMKGHGNIYIIDKLGGLKVVGLDVYINHIQLLELEDKTNIMNLSIRENNFTEEYTPYTLNLLSGKLVRLQK